MSEAPAPVGGDGSAPLPATEGSQGEAEWEDQYGRPDSQEMGDDVHAALPLSSPPPQPLPLLPPSPPPPASDCVDDSLDRAVEQQSVAAVVAASSLPSQSETNPLSPAVPLIDLTDLIDERSSALPTAPSPPQRGAAQPMEVVDITEDDDEPQRHTKRRRITTEEKSHSPASSPPLPLRRASPELHPSPLSPSLLPSVDVVQPSAPSTSPPPSPSPSMHPPADSVESFLSFDVDFFLSSLPSVLPQPAPPTWSPPPPPYSLVHYSDSLPTFDLGPSSSRFPRKPRSLKTFPPNLRLQPLLLAIDKPDPSPLTLNHVVRLFGSAVPVFTFARSALSCFDELQWRLARLLQASTTEEESLTTAQRVAEDVRDFLVFLIAYVREVLPSLPALERSVMAHVLETSLMATAQRLLSLRLPVYDVHCRSGRGVHCAALYAHLMTHSALMQLHSIFLTHISSLPHVSSVRLPSSSSPIDLPPVGSRWPFRCYAFYLLSDLLRLHLCHVAIGSVPFAIYHALPSIDDPRAQAPLSKAAVPVVHQPVLALWRELIAYTDHLHDRQHREEATHQQQRWSEELGFLFCREEDIDEQRSLLDHLDELRPVTSLNTEFAEALGNVDETSTMSDFDVGDDFPCFYSLLNLTLDAFLLNPALCSPSASVPLLCIPVPSFPRAELIADCVQPTSKRPLSNVAREICDRVEVVWELLIDVILPCYSLSPLCPFASLSPDAMMALCSSYSLYDEPSPPRILRLELYRRSASPTCACRPHWSLLYLLLRVGMAHVSSEWRAEYSKCTLGRLCSIIHVWPSVHIEPLILKLHTLCGLDADPLTSTAPVPRLSQGLSSLQHYPPFLFADPVDVPVHCSDDDGVWCRYLSLLYIFLRMVAEAQLPFGCNPDRQPLLSHNRFSHHSLLFCSHTADLRIISSLYHLFPSPSSVFSCSTDHSALNVVMQLASLHLLASLVSEAEARQAHIHLEKLIDWRQSRCFHSHSLLLLCWSSLLSMRIERGMETGDAIQRFNEVLRHLVQQLMDQEEDVEALQCAVWAPPRDWTEEERRVKAIELKSHRTQVEDRRRRVVESAALLKRLLIKKMEWSAHLGADCALLIGEVIGLPLSQSFSLDSPSFVLDLLRPDRPVVLPLRQHALRVIELVVRSRYAVNEPVAASAAAGQEEKAEGDSQDSDEVEREVRAVEQRRAEEERLRHWPSFLRFLSTAHRILLDIIRTGTDPVHQDSALLLLNPHRAELLTRVTLDSHEMDRYRRMKKDHRATKAQFRRQGTRALDDLYRVDKGTLTTCIGLYTDISHVLLAHPDRLSILRLVIDFGVVKSEDAGDALYWHRYLPLLMWDGFLSSKVVDARHFIDRALFTEVDRCALLTGLLSALLDPSTWCGEGSSVPLPSLLSSTLAHPAFRRYQQPAVDAVSQCSTMGQLTEHRADIIDRLFRGIGARYHVNASHPSLHRADIELHRALLPPLLDQLSGHHDRLVQRSVGGRAEPDRSPPVLDAADADYIRFLYRVLTCMWQHCLPLLHPRHAKDQTPIEGALITFYDKVIPVERPSSTPSSFTFTLHLPTSLVHQEAALASWPHLLWGMDRLSIDPKKWLPAEGGVGASPLPICIRAVVGTIRHFWPRQVRAEHPSLTPLPPHRSAFTLLVVVHSSTSLLVLWSVAVSRPFTAGAHSRSSASDCPRPSQLLEAAARHHRRGPSTSSAGCMAHYRTSQLNTSASHHLSAAESTIVLHCLLQTTTATVLSCTLWCSSSSGSGYAPSTLLCRAESDNLRFVVPSADTAGEGPESGEVCRSPSQARAPLRFTFLPSLLVSDPHQLSATYRSTSHPVGYTDDADVGESKADSHTSSRFGRPCFRKKDHRR